MCTYDYIGKHKAAALFTDVPGGPFGFVAWPIFPTKFLHSSRAASRSFRRPA